ncbi:hypothetical protein M3Y97_00172400 [Aphelenchoides bicaudatus]|nr:hypothetical protein M3Y97_00172400 [Aphelenchoides bicaudatus]
MDSSSVQRIHGNIVKPIVYGNYAEKLSRALPNNHSHKWRMFVRPFFDEDIGRYVRKVQFRLHDSYLNPLRTVESPPFEIEETGWGEFEASIKIFFVDSNEKPLTAAYYLRLFQPVISKPDGKPAVLYEHYDEIIFVDPTVQMATLLKEGTSKVPIKSPTDFASEKARNLEAINVALNEVNEEVDKLRVELRQLAQQRLSRPTLE